MEKEEINLIIDSQRKFFASGKTLEHKIQAWDPEKAQVTDIIA